LPLRIGFKATVRSFTTLTSDLDVGEMQLSATLIIRF
jgi:hypothetical protein